MDSKNAVIKGTIILATLAFVLIAMLFTELSLRHSGYEPGWYYTGLREVSDPQIDSAKQVTRITPDSFNVVKFVWRDYPLNRQGFISTIDYDSVVLAKVNKRKVMVIGDSFTEGSVPSYDSSYVARLGRMMPDIFFLNFGVGGTDPLNYELILKKYLPIVRPDLVIVAFCGGNDQMIGDNRKPQNKYPIMWNTNFAWGGIDTRIPSSISHSPNEYFPSADSMYRFLYHYYHINGIYRSTLAKVMSKTCVTTRLWFVSHPEPPNMFSQGDGTTTSYCHEHLLEMKRLCDTSQVPMMIAYIPPKDRLGYKMVFPYLAGDSYYPTMTASDYDNGNPMDIHWGSKGHENFALFLKPIIERKLAKN